MTPYTVVLSLLGLLAIASLSLPRRAAVVRPFFIGIAATILIIFMGLRNHVGTDWPTYDLIYRNLSNAPLWLGFLITEPGYAILNDLSAFVGAGIYLVNIICALLMVGGIIWFAGLLDIDHCLTLFLSTPYLLFVVGMGYTRQAVAIGISLCAIGFLARGKYRSFYISACLATCFHYSAIVVFLLHWLRTWRRICIAGVAVLAVTPRLLAILNHPRYGQYLRDQSSGVYLRLLIILLGIIAVFIFRSKLRENAPLFSLLKRGSVVGLAFLVIAPIDSTLVDRVGLYLFFIYLSMMGLSIRYSPSYLRWLIIVFLFGLSYSIFGIWFGFSHYAANYWLPYRAGMI